MKKPTLIVLAFLCSLSISLGQIEIIAQDDQAFPVDENCTATPEICFTFTDSETTLLTTYKAEVLVDIYGDWTYDYVYSTEAEELNDNYGTPENELFIPIAPHNFEICLKIPETISGSKHLHRSVIRIERLTDGYFTAKTTEFTITDLTPPIAYELPTFEVQFDNFSTVELLACDYIQDAEDNCSNEFRYTFFGPEDGYETPEDTPGWNHMYQCESREFSCYDACEENPKKVQIYTWDEYDNYFITETTINFSSYSSCCGDPPATCLNGQIILGDEQHMEGGGVSISINAPEYPFFEEWQPDGNYSHCKYANWGRPYSITPYNNENAQNGLSTVDIAVIENHIAGISQFTNPYQYIAADINNDGTINQVDVDELEQLVQGQIETFSNNTSWRFHAADVPLDLNNPYAIVETVSDTVDFHNHMVQDFIGIKIGDIDGCYDNTVSSISTIQGQPGFDVNIVSANPFSDQVTAIILSDQIGDVKLEIFNAEGKIVQNCNIELYNFSTVVNIQAALLPVDGIYYCRFSTEKESVIKKIILAR